jgi:hypothetical protein
MATNTSTDYLARHPFDDAKVHLMPAKYAEAIFTAVDTYGVDSKKTRLPRMEAKVRCNAQKRTMHVAISPKRIQVQDGPLPENMCAKCMSHLA